MSAVNITRWPFKRLIPSMLYPNAPSITENASVVTVSIRSTSSIAVAPKLNSFKFASNSIIGLTARAD